MACTYLYACTCTHAPVRMHRGVARRGSGVVPDPAATQTTPPPPPSPTHNNRSQLENGTSQSTSHSVLVYSPKNKYAVQVYTNGTKESALHMVGVGNQASSPSSKNTLRTICTSTKVEIFLLVPGHPGTTPSYAPACTCTHDALRLNWHTTRICTVFFCSLVKSMFVNEFQNGP